jgi:epoxyqueuosine reductase
MNSEDLTSYALTMVDKAGIAEINSFEYARKGEHPRDLLPDCQSVLVFCVKHLDVFSRSQNKDSQAYSQDLTKHMMMHAAYSTSRYIEKQGFKAFPITGSYHLYPIRKKEDSVGRISLRHAAQVAGIGYISRIGIILTKEYGPEVQLGAILTNAELTADEPVSSDPCIKCNLCIKICPSGAIREPGRGEPYLPVNKDFCLDYRKENGGNSPLGYKRQCALCRSVCPVGRV